MSAHETRWSARDCLRSSFWLLVPVLLLNVLCARSLPPSYQRTVFWRDIPPPIAVPENVLRGVVMLLPVVFPLRLETARHRAGAWTYLGGLLLYLGSWAILIAAPRAAWSTSAIGFTAPAWTPAFWLAGIGCFADRTCVPRLPSRPWVYWVPSAAFVLFHVAHAWLVHARGA